MCGESSDNKAFQAELSKKDTRIRSELKKMELCISTGQPVTWQVNAYLIGPVVPSGPLSSEGGTGSHLKCSPQLKPPLTIGEGE